ncbi:MAG: hypothetical protein JOY90_15295 [Bradyrhizobium sp.]|uniref:hypothetical protein n=1 Tax=Bradyrhizobium sp. TaxID=376 RepID=UPI001DC76A6C|nr:hypothetical protein [Bradyrhizobium sp.]MBV9561792.1 hypothetical protein [Bradyrhizobium sp.]
MTIGKPPGTCLQGFEMNNPLHPMFDLLTRHPTLTVQCSADDRSAVITSADGTGSMDVDFWVQHHTPCVTTTYRRSVVFAPGDHLHYWIGIRDSGGVVIHRECICGLGRLGALVDEWIGSEVALPGRLRVAPTAVPPRAALAGPVPTLSQDIDAACLQSLPDPAAAEQRVRIDVSRIDVNALLQSFPRDGRGRLATKVRALLGAYGPPTRKRQPCLLVTSAATQRAMPALRAHLSMEFATNHRLDWRSAPWLWTAAPPPPTTPTIEQARTLLAQGRIEDACEPFGVQFSAPLRRLAAGQPFRRFVPIQPSWPDELAVVLRQLAPWRLQDGLAQIHRHLCSINKQEPRPGSIERKLVWFSGQRRQAKFGLGVGLTADDKAELRIVATASNEYFPEPDWRDTAANP